MQFSVTFVRLPEWSIALGNWFACIPACTSTTVSISLTTLIETLLKHIQTYPGTFSTLCNLLIFTILTYSEPLACLEPTAYLKPCKTLTWHIQNPAIFRYINNLEQRSYIQKPGILRILEYSESFHNCILTHIKNPVIFMKIYKYSLIRTYLKPDTYSEPSQRFEMECFAKIVKNYNYFSKALHLRSLTEFWIILSLNKYSLALL